jgi:hypothetical protein
MSLTTLTSVQKLQMALHAKAKESPDFRFYALYEDRDLPQDTEIGLQGRRGATQGCRTNRQPARDPVPAQLEDLLDHYAQPSHP